MIHITYTNHLFSPAINCGDMVKDYKDTLPKLKGEILRFFTMHYILKFVDYSLLADYDSVVSA